jgi:hypothetical protein
MMSYIVKYDVKYRKGVYFHGTISSLVYLNINIITYLNMDFKRLIRHDGL